ncbi:phage antirepressor KilAC domain-containing protein [Bermanella sp. R86510]|uniref:phage antirepressor KilAC domain-containing protein n=1 Tax=unclassified Bermanella TaxID=2627862 RepID=UPI0037C57BBF
MIISKEKLYSMTDVANSLSMPRNELFKRLRFAGLLYESKQLRNIPKPKYIRAGLLTTRFKMFCIGKKPQIHEQTFATESGVDFIQDLIAGKEPSVKPNKRNYEIGKQVLSQLKAQINH